jgi:hypothetical protein
MIRLNMIVEGQTEETFVRDVLTEHLAARSVFVSCRCVETSRDRKHGKVYRGGLLSYARARNDLHRWMKEDQRPEAHFTTMFDLYALPDDFPGREEARRLTAPQARAEALEAAFARDVDHRRFRPYLQLHEFEALLLSDPSKFDWEFMEHEQAIARLVALSESVSSPEEIDEGEDTAPSKRIIREIPEYEGRKASAGPLIAAKIGLTTLREKCPHFNAWLARIEVLGAVP